MLLQLSRHKTDIYQLKLTEVVICIYFYHLNVKRSFNKFLFGFQDFQKNFVMSLYQDCLLKRPDELVDCWCDTERMEFLLSAFPESAELNPEHWKGKMDFWSKLIKSLFYHSSLACVNMKTVQHWIAWKGRMPLGFRIVWNEMINNGSLVDASDYLGDMERNSSWFGWGVNMFVRKPTLWVAGKMLSPLKTLSPVKTNTDEKFYVCVEAFEEKCNTALQLLHTSHSHAHVRLISSTDLYNLFKDITPQKRDAEMLLVALEKLKKIAVFKQNSSPRSQTFIKFGPSPEAAVEPVNESDIGIVQLIRAKTHLEEQISSLYTQQRSLLDDARAYVKKGERTMAKNCLRQKQRVLHSITKKESSLDNIQQLLLKLEQCSTDQMVLEAYKAGMSAYKASAVNIDDVDTTMDDLASALSDHDEIASAISSPIDSSESSIDDLEKELSELLMDKSDDLTSNQTDADIAKLVTSMASISTHVPTPVNKPQSSPRKKLMKQIAT